MGLLNTNQKEKAKVVSNISQKKLRHFFEPQDFVIKIHRYLTIYYTCVSINTIVHPDTFRTQVSRLGTDTFILMELLLATLLSCESAQSIIDNIKSSTPNRAELVEVIQENTEKGCFEDAKAD